MQTDFDVQQHNKRMLNIWNKVSEGWHKWSDLMENWTKDSTFQMIEEAELNEGSRVLDVAAGDGSQSILAAEIVGSEGYVLSTDISENLLKLAEKTAKEKGYTQIETKFMQAEKLEIEDQTFDAVICKNGLMLFGDREKATQEIYRVLKPGRKFSAVVFSAPEKNPWMSLAGKMIMESANIPPSKPGEPGLFSLSQPHEIESLLRSKGFVDISVSKVEYPLKVPSNIDFVKFLHEAPGMLVLLFNKLSSEQQTRVMNRLREAFVQFQTDQGYSFPAEFLVLSGRKPTM